jgi:hypothetical protein
MNMMKKIFPVLWLFLLLSSCSKDDDRLFPDSATDRMETRVRDNRDVLNSAENGWIMTYYPSSIQQYGGYTLFVKFDEGGNVAVASELRKASEPEIITSLYDVLPESGPVLSFSSYNSFVHYFSEPRNPNGPVELGMGGDYEFMMMEATIYEVVLKGKKTSNRIVLTPIEYGEDWSALMSEYTKAAKTMDFLEGRYNPNGMEIIVQKSEYRSLKFYYTEDGASLVVTIPFHYTPDGMQFYKPLTIGGVEINALLYVDDPAAPYFIDAGDTDTRLTITIK